MHIDEADYDGKVVVEQLQWGELAERLSRAFDDFTLGVFEERHHFDPPHRIEPERLARSLQTLWERAEAARPSPIAATR